MSESNQFIRAAEDFNNEVQTEAARIVELEGLALWPALEKARQNILRDRARKRMQKTAVEQLEQWQ